MESQAQRLCRVIVLCPGRKWCEDWSHGARTMNQKPRSLFALSLEPGRSQSSFLSSCFLKTLTQLTDVTCAAVSQSGCCVGQWKKPTQISETSFSCPIGLAHCLKENTLTSNKMWIYSVGESNLFPLHSQPLMFTQEKLPSPSSFLLCLSALPLKIRALFLEIPGMDGPTSRKAKMIPRRESHLCFANVDHAPNIIIC